jgi:hypothetical protein
MFRIVADLKIIYYLQPLNFTKLMKFRFSKVWMLTVTVLMVTVFSSCTQEYVCKCTIVYTGLPGLPDTLVKEYPVRDTKKKAKAVCEENSSTSTSDKVTTTETCELY